MRIYHLDMKVCMFTQKYLKSWFERLSATGFEGVMVELDNKLRFPSHPEFASEDALSAEEWNSIVRYARHIGLAIYPLIQTLGHMEHVLRPGSPYENLAESPGNDYLLCPSKEGTLSFVKDLIRDADDIFEHPGRIHLGGDESPGIGVCPRCHGAPIAELLGGHIKKLAEYALELGIRPEFWSDMVLAHPEGADNLPREIVLVDWLYDRTTLFSASAGQCRGAAHLLGKDMDSFNEQLPDSLRGLIPYLVTSDGMFDNFYGPKYLKDKGFEVMLASAVRSWGDCYSLPRTRMSSMNVGVTEEAALDMGCDHVVTSWAVRLSHPETTWPALLSRNATEDECHKRLAQSLGCSGSEFLDDLTVAQEGLLGIDILMEHEMRFQRPYRGQMMQAISDALNSGSREATTERMRARAEACDQALSRLENQSGEESGNGNAPRHWILGLRMCSVKSRQTVAVLDQYRRPADAGVINALISENRALMEEFSHLWRESVTERSLDSEMEVKFRRDISFLEALR